MFQQHINHVLYTIPRPAWDVIARRYDADHRFGLAAADGASITSGTTGVYPPGKARTRSGRRSSPVLVTVCYTRALEVCDIFRIFLCEYNVSPSVCIDIIGKRVDVGVIVSDWPNK